MLSGQKENHIYPNGDEIFGIDMVYMIDEFEGVPTPDNDEVVDLKWFSMEDLPENIHKPDVNFIPIVRNYLNHNSFVVD